jgi:hypothetical protein
VQTNSINPILNWLLKWFTGCPSAANAASRGWTREGPTGACGPDSAHTREPGGSPPFTQQSFAQTGGLPPEGRYEYEIHRRLSPGEPLLAFADVERITPTGITLAILNTKVILQSGAVVAPGDLRAVCSEPGCNAFESRVLRCVVCARACCRLHAAQLYVGDECLVFCPTHGAEAIAEWHAWKNDALQRGVIWKELGPPKLLAVLGPRTPKPIQADVPTIPQPEQADWD